ncbi:MAG: hypothetical protein NVSMB13_17940 [Mycobacteriales bacterium]
MPAVDLIDETFLVVDPATLAARVHDPALWRSWWPGLTLSVFEDRGAQGLRWTVTGDLVGSSEVWLEPFRDGVLVHYYLRAELTARGSDTEVLTRPRRWVRRRALAAGRRHSAELKRAVNALKDELEASRPAGAPRTAAEPTATVLTTTVPTTASGGGVKGDGPSAEGKA